MDNRDNIFSFEIDAVQGFFVPDEAVLYDLVIAGWGPAAVSAAIYAARKGLNTAIVTKFKGGQINDTPVVENYPGFKSIGGKELTLEFNVHARQYGLPLLTGEAVTKIEKNNDIFYTSTENQRILKSRTVIYATGKRNRRLNVPGEEKFIGKGVVFCAICDAPLYKDKKVIIAGGNNSAFTVATDLVKIAKNIVIINIVRGWTADSYLQNSLKKYNNVEMLDYHRIESITGNNDFKGIKVRNLETSGLYDIDADGLFVEIGLIPNSDAVAGLVALNDNKEIITDRDCETSLPGLFAAGDVTDVTYKQVVIAAGEGAKAALSADNYLKFISNKGE
ncbi:MAG: FAD-dependent oxidoreductase [Oligoflexia bacterium]|nr:FAD-dependent oxidoreductase [Oligoflexia bacterium]